MKVFLCGLLLALLSVSSFAQSAPRVEVFGGYSFLRSEGASFNGGAASLAINPHDNIGIVADYSIHFGPLNSNLQTLTFGPQFSYRSPRFTLFGRGLAGGARLGAPLGSVYFATFGGGGGLDLKVNDHLALRVLQADWLVYRNPGVGPNSNAVRLGAGVVFGK